MVIKSVFFYHHWPTKYIFTTMDTIIFCNKTIIIIMKPNMKISPGLIFVKETKK